MKLNKAGIDLIKHFEGCKLEAYKDLVGIWTIGYGFTGEWVTPGLVISQEKADEMLNTALNRFEDNVTDLVEVDLNDNQFSALVSFAYNLGCGALQRSTLLKKLNKEDFIGASQEFIKWNHAGGKVVAGLTKRRSEETQLFLS